MTEHIAISDDPERVQCSCGKTFEGPKAREGMAVHFQLERARAALRGEENCPAPGRVGHAVVLYRNEDDTVDVIAHPTEVIISREYVENPPPYCEVDGNGFFIHAANGTFRYRLFDLNPFTDRYTARYKGTAEEGDLADIGWDRYKEGDLADG